MRGTIAGLGSPSSLVDILPAMLQEDAFARGLCSGLDEVLAPVLLSLDAFPAYLDLTTTPPDMLPWLGQWLGMTVDPGQSPDTQRGLLQSAGELHATRGTRRGMELAMSAALGLPVEVAETGGAAWSATPDGELPGEAEPRVVVTVRAAAGQQIDLEEVEALVRSVKPAHVQHRIEVASG